MRVLRACLFSARNAVEGQVHRRGWTARWVLGLAIVLLLVGVSIWMLPLWDQPPCSSFSSTCNCAEALSPIQFISKGQIQTATVDGIPSTALFIRLNQVGYSPDDQKIALVMSRSALSGAFSIEHLNSGTIVFSGTLGADLGDPGEFVHLYPLDFSSLTTPGTYCLHLLDRDSSTVFSVDVAVYNELAELSRRFFSVQRSGDTNPAGHAPSHLEDAPLSSNPNQHRNVTGGWYDAGDYLKFTLTNAYATLLILLAYRDTPQAFQEFDAAGVPEILNEAQVGLDWLERMWDPNEPMLYVQVGSKADHRQPLVGPENDPLSGTAERPVYAAEAGRGANLAGKTSAAFAVASQIYDDRASPVYNPAKALHYRRLAESIYSWGESRPVSQPTFPNELYNEITWEDDMALAATELYRLTGAASYRQAAHRYAQAAGPARWFSWEKLNGLAHIELARTDPDYRPMATQFLKEDLTRFQASASSNPWGVVSGDNLVWGSLYPILGAALEADWYEELTGETTYRALGQAQLDYVFGRNPWGVSFLIGAGANWPRDPHHRIAQLNLAPLGLELEGAWVGGPVVISIFENEKIRLAAPDEYASFQSTKAVYHDDVNDYVTNEPSVSLNATGLLLMTTLTRPD